MWKFDIRHYPGKAMSAADTTSRYLILAEENDTETAFLANLAARATPIDKVASSAKSDDAHWAKCAARSAGTAPAPSTCKELHRYSDKLCPRDGIPMYVDQPAIPREIRVRVWDTPHAAFQGHSSMLHRAAQTEFRPGCIASVKKRMASSHTRHASAPTKQNEAQIASPQANSMVAKAGTPPRSPVNQTIQHRNRVGTKRKKRAREPPLLLARRGGLSRMRRRARELPLPLDMTLETAGSTTSGTYATTATISAQATTSSVEEKELSKPEHSRMEIKDLRQHSQSRVCEE